MNIFVSVTTRLKWFGNIKKVSSLDTEHIFHLYNLNTYTVGVGSTSLMCQPDKNGRWECTMCYSAKYSLAADSVRMFVFQKTI